MKTIKIIILILISSITFADYTARVTLEGIKIKNETPPPVDISSTKVVSFFMTPRLETINDSGYIFNKIGAVRSVQSGLFPSSQGSFDSNNMVSYKGTTYELSSLFVVEDVSSNYCTIEFTFSNPLPIVYDQSGNILLSNLVEGSLNINGFNSSMSVYPMNEFSDSRTHLSYNTSISCTDGLFSNLVNNIGSSIPVTITFQEYNP